ncbi:MAG: mobilization protein [Candidatus Methylumidiphilus sp.]
MGKIHFIGGEKGGVGKSLVSRVLSQYFIDHERPFVGFDTDKSHGSLLRFYAGYASPVVIDSYESLDRVMEAATEEPERCVLVDLAAQTHQSLAQWMADSALFDLSEELGVELTYWHVMDSGQDSVDLLRTLLDQFGGKLKLVVVLNEVRSDNFKLLANSGERARAEALGAKFISIARLQESAMQKIDGQGTSFWAALNPAVKTANGLGLLERQRVKVWLKKAYGQIERLSV